MKRYPDALVQHEADVEGVAAEVPAPTLNTYRVITLTKQIHGCVGVTTVRVRQPGGQTTDVQGFTLPDALRRLAGLVDREQGHEDVRVVARALILDLCKEINRLMKPDHDEVSTELWQRTTRVLGRLRDELALDEALAPPDDEQDGEAS